MYALDLELGIFDGPPTVAPPPVDVEVFREALEALVRIDMIELRADTSIPPLYELARRGEIVYRDPGAIDDPWCDVRRARRRGVIDCEDAAAWLVAELRVRRGVMARIGFSISPHPDGRRRAVHIYVRLPNGTTEDPSIVLQDIERARRGG